MGVAVNRRLQATVAAVLPDIEELRSSSDLAYLGGPVGLREMMFLIRLDQAASDSTHVVDDIHVSSSLALLATMAAKSNGLSNVRVFVGYAGWAAGQLDVEILRGDWHVMTADASTVFDVAPADIWPRLIARAARRIATNRVTPAPDVPGGARE